MRAFNFSRFTSGQAVRAATEAIVADTRRALSAASSLRDLDRALTTFYNAAMPIQFLRLTSTHEEVRAAASESQGAVERMELEVVSDRRLFEIVRNEQCEGDKEATRAKELYLVDFELKGGAALGEEAQKELMQLKNRIVELQGRYSKNLADDATKVAVSREELAGLGDDFISGLEQTPEGLFVVTLRYPHVNPVMQLATSEETRKKLWIASCHKAVPANLELLPEIVTLRRRIAELLLGPNHCDADLAVARGRRMAGESVEDVTTFLDRIETMLKEKAASELKDLHEIKGSTVIYPWDAGFLGNLRQKRKYNLDHELIKQYFPLDQVLSGVFACYSKLLGVRFERDHEAESVSWHPDVQAYKMYDAQTETYLARFYLDLHPRQGKYTHAACWWMGKKGQEDGTHPTVCMITNFSEKTADAPALLRFSEVETMYHEFGHVCHACLSNNSFQRLNWTWQTVEMDFLEVPSMCFEKFIFDPSVLKLLSRHYETGETLPENLRLDLVRARNCSDGRTWLRVIDFARFDFLIHSKSPPPSSTWEAIRAESSRRLFGLTLPDELVFPTWCNMDHMVTGYNSGYYSYLWSEVVASALFAKFEEKGDFLDPELGARLRRTVLEPCARDSGKAMVRNFLGHDATEEPFRASVYS